MIAFDTSMKITVLIDTLNGGGAERMFINLAQELYRSGADVEFVVLNGNGPLRALLSSDLPFVDLCASRIMTGVPRLVKYLKKRKPDVILSGKTAMNIAASAAHLLARSNARLILSERTILSDMRHRKGIKDFVAQRVTKYSYKRASAFIAISGDCAQALHEVARIPIEKISIIHNPVIDPAFWVRSEEPVDHPWMQGDHEVVMGIGRLSLVKGFDDLIDAFALVKQESAKLIILGEGSEREALQQKIKILGLQDRVNMPGFVNNPVAWLNRARAFCLSSHSEPFGNVLVEALALRVPIVSRDCAGGPREILSTGGGEILPEFSKQSVAAAIERALQGHILASQKADLSKYTSSYVCEEYLNVLKGERP